MKRFVFFLVVLLAIIIFLFYGLLKGNNASTDTGYIISESKNQSFSLIQKTDNVFVLNGCVSDGTHTKMMIKVMDKDSDAAMIEDAFDITTEPFQREIKLPNNKKNAYINLYYNEGMGIGICYNSLLVTNNDGKWSIAENKFTEANSKLLGVSNKNDYLYSKSELENIPQGIFTLSDMICKAHNNDYDKAYAIYVWLCEHMYKTSDLQDKSLEYTYNTRTADYETYANLFAAMLRVQGIPCAVVECNGGYYFNEVYVNNKWINVQIDQNTFNKYQSHRYIYDRKNLYTHFGVPTNTISALCEVKSIKK